MSRPWTLPSAEYRKEIKTVTPSIEDFDTIRANLERIKKEQEEATKNGIDISTNAVETGKTPEDIDLDYGCSGTSVEPSLSTYEMMEQLLDENDALISKYFPDPRIQKLIEKYGLKVDNESLWPHRILPGL